MIGSQIFSKKFTIFPKYFFQLKWKWNWNQLYILTSALFELGIAIEIRQIHKRFIKLPIFI